MKTLKFFLLFGAFTLVGSKFLIAQDFQVILHETFKYDTLGDEIVFDFEVVNTSTDTQDVFEVRTLNNKPADWYSSLCFGQLCYPPDTDSIATGHGTPNPSVAPQDTLITSLHIQTLDTSGTANVTIEIGLLGDPNTRTTINFIATTDPTLGVKNKTTPTSYFLEQNYPNPFNPSTNINYGLKESGFVSLKIYNILGTEVATLVNGYKPAGNYKASFDASRLPSGVYIYSLKTNNFIQTRKMILEK